MRYIFSHGIERLPYNVTKIYSHTHVTYICNVFVMYEEKWNTSSVHTCSYWINSLVGFYIYLQNSKVKNDNIRRTIIDVILDEEKKEVKKRMWAHKV